MESSLHRVLRRMGWQGINLNLATVSLLARRRRGLLRLKPARPIPGIETRTTGRANARRQHSGRKQYYVWQREDQPGDSAAAVAPRVNAYLRARWIL